MSGAVATSQPQDGDWPPGYVPGQGFTQPPQAQEGDWPPGYQPGQAPPAANGAPQAPNGSSEPSVPLGQLKLRPQWIDCPNCKTKSQTQVQGRSEGKQKFMNIFWWPLPNRKHWWETTHWYCKHCHKEIATQKNGKPVEVLVKPE